MIILILIGVALCAVGYILYRHRSAVADATQAAKSAGDKVGDVAQAVKDAFKK